MLIYFFKADGSPYMEGKTAMVGGTQENPVLQWIEKRLVVYCHNRKIGDKFSMQTNDGYSNPSFLIFEDGKARQVYE